MHWGWMAMWMRTGCEGEAKEGGEARERKPRERNYRRWSLKSSSAWSNGIVDLGFSQVEPSGYWLLQDLSIEKNSAQSNYSEGKDYPYFVFLFIRTNFDLIEPRLLGEINAVSFLWCWHSIHFTYLFFVFVIY